MSRVGLFFGSFSPIHNGHVAIAQHVLANSDLNEVWLVVSPQSPFKEAEQLLPFVHRFAMVELALEGEDGITASNVEASLPVPSFTIDTLRQLKVEFPQNDFVVLMGGDNLAGFSRWKDHSEILEQFGIICYSRADYEKSEFAEHPQVTVLNAPFLPQSSTEIREKLSNGEDVSDHVHPKVLEYLLRHSLFE